MAFTQISTKGIKDGTITGADLATNVDLADNQKIRFGAGNDLQIHHDASDSIISNTSGVFYIQNTGDLRLRVNNTEAAVHCVANGAVELYHNNNKKLETHSGGVNLLGSGTDAIQMTGDVWFNNNEHAGADVYFNSGDKHLIFEDNVTAKFGGAGDLQIFHDGGNSYIKEAGTGNVIHEVTDATIEFKKGGSEHLAKFIPDGAVELYHDNSKKLETKSDGVKISGVCTATHGFLIDDTATTQDQARGIRWTAFDKEGTNDPSDIAGIIWTVNDSGLSGSVLKIFVENDDNDGVVIKGGNTTGAYGTKIVNGLEIKSGGLRPTTGTSQNGIRWGDDFAGGSGDRCSIQYFQDGSGEDTRLRLFIENDSQDDIRLEAPSTVHIQGSLSKSSGSFRIPHVLPDLTKTTDLIHSFVESPQADNIYRGRAKLVNGTAAINIDTTNNMTEGTFVNLNRDVQCFTTNETGWTAIKGSVTDNILTITAQDNTCTDTISWMVIGERWDLAMYDPKNPMTDENGKIKTEIANNSINKGGDFEQDYIKENKYRVGISTIARPSIENKEVE